MVRGGTGAGVDTNAGIAATVQLKNSSGTNGGIAVTAAGDGTYTISDVSAANGYRIAVTMNGYENGTIYSVDVAANLTDKDLRLTKKAVYAERRHRRHNHYRRKRKQL